MTTSPCSLVTFYFPNEVLKVKSQLSFSDCTDRLVSSCDDRLGKSEFITFQSHRINLQTCKVVHIKDLKEECTDKIKKEVKLVLDCCTIIFKVNPDDCRDIDRQLNDSVTITSSVGNESIICLVKAINRVEFL